MTRLSIFLIGLMAVGGAACASSPDSPHTAVAIGATSTETTAVRVSPASPPSSTASATPGAPPEASGRGDAIGAPVGGKPDREAIGAPVGGRPAAQATGSPFNMPRITFLQGLTVAQAFDSIRKQLAEACGTPTPCVTISERLGDNDSFTRCQIDRFEPGDGEIVARGSVVYIVTGTATPCEEEPPTEEPPPTTTRPTTTVRPTTTRLVTSSTVTAP